MMDSLENIVHENFRGLVEVIDDLDIAIFYKHLVETVAQEYANQQTKESLSTIRSLALQLDRKGVKTLIDEIDKMIDEL